MTRSTSIAIHLLLALLTATPLHYYLVNQDKRDERFAWRMFSPIRIEKCGAHFLLGEARTPIKASKFFHPAWVGLAQRGRQQIITAMGERLCEKHPGQELYIRLQCETHPGSAQGSRGGLYDLTRRKSDENVELVAPGVFNFCKTGAL